MHRNIYLLFVILFVFIIPKSVIAQRDESEVILNERRVYVNEDGKMETRTKRIIHVLSQRDVDKFKYLNIKIESERESFELVKAVCYEKQKNGKYKLNMEGKAKISFTRAPYLTQIHIIMPLEKPGDRIEYETRLVRDKPLFGDNFWNMFKLGDEYPVKKAIFTVVYPSTKQLFYQMQGLDIKPIIKDDGKTKKYTWEADNIPSNVSPQTINNGAIPTIMVASTNTWADVADWFSEKYNEMIETSQTIRKTVEMLTKNTDLKVSGKEKDVFALVRFVTNNIVQISNEDESDLLIPEMPEKTLASRKGDCKNKAVLLASLLRAIDIKSCPVLTNTDKEYPLDSMLPTPYYFNHAIVYVPKQDGIAKEMWLDPVTQNKRGINDYKALKGLLLCGKGENTISDIGPLTWE